MCIYTHMHMHTYIDNNMYNHTHIDNHIYTHTYIYTTIYTYIQTIIYTHIYIDNHIYTHAYIQTTTYTQIYRQQYTHTHIERETTIGHLLIPNRECLRYCSSAFIAFRKSLLLLHRVLTHFLLHVFLLLWVDFFPLNCLHGYHSLFFFKAIY